VRAQPAGLHAGRTCAEWSCRRNTSFASSTNGSVPNWHVPKRALRPVLGRSGVGLAALELRPAASHITAAADLRRRTRRSTSTTGRTTSAINTIAEFERATHIKVVYQTYDSNETLEAKTLMVGHSGYDIVSTTTGFYGRQIKAGAYLPLDKSKLPNWKNSIRRCSRSRRRPIRAIAMRCRTCTP
jgi:hypothetical protein